MASNCVVMVWLCVRRVHIHTRNLMPSIIPHICWNFRFFAVFITFSCFCTISHKNRHFLADYFRWRLLTNHHKYHEITWNIINHKTDCPSGIQNSDTNWIQYNHTQKETIFARIQHKSFIEVIPFFVMFFSSTHEFIDKHDHFLSQKPLLRQYFCCRRHICARDQQKQTEIVYVWSVVILFRLSEKQGAVGWAREWAREGDGRWWNAIDR